MGMATACPQQGQVTQLRRLTDACTQPLTFTVATCRSTGEISGTTTAGDRQTDSMVMLVCSQACCRPQWARTAPGLSRAPSFPPPAALRPTAFMESTE